MSDNIPFEIQTEIFKWLPITSLIQIRSVCKAWKSVIDSAAFIKNYSGQTERLLARYKDTVDIQEKFILIADNDTFPHQKVSLNSHPLIDTLQIYKIIGSSHGLLCLFGEGPVSDTGRAVIWNPSIRKAVAVDVPDVEGIHRTEYGFGVCRETNDPKIVKLTHIKRWSDIESDNIPWQVEVFTLSTRAWRSPYSTNLPRNSIEFDYKNTVVIDGVLYWLATIRITFDGEFNFYNLIISFDMTSEEFKEVNLPDCLAHQLPFLSIHKLRESLVVLEEVVEANNTFYRVWMMEDVVPKLFTKIFTIHFPDVYVDEFYVTGFRKTGDPVIYNAPAYPLSLVVYEPYSRSITSLGIDGSDFSDFVYSHKETLLLL